MNDIGLNDGNLDGGYGDGQGNGQGSGYGDGPGIDYGRGDAGVRDTGVIA